MASKESSVVNKFIGSLRLIKDVYNKVKELLELLEKEKKILKNARNSENIEKKIEHLKDFKNIHSTVLELYREIISEEYRQIAIGIEDYNKLLQMLKMDEETIEKIEEEANNVISLLNEIGSDANAIKKIRDSIERIKKLVS